jgi:hypothetical protein
VDVGQQYGRSVGDLGGGERWREGARQAAAFAVGVGEVRVDVQDAARTFDRHPHLPEPPESERPSSYLKRVDPADQVDPDHLPFSNLRRRNAPRTGSDGDQISTSRVALQER